MIYRPLILAQKQQGGFRVLTEGLGRLELQRRGADGDVPRRRRDEAGGPGGAGLLRASGGSDRCAASLRSRQTGQRGAEVADGVKSRWCSHSPAAVLGEIPVRAGPGVAGGCLGELRDLVAKP